MTDSNTCQPTVVRTPGGPFIGGARISLYDVMDYLKADWPPHLIRQWLNLTDGQMRDVLQYIDAHHAKLQEEYQKVLQQSEEIRQYWDEQNRERLARAVARPPNPAQEAVRFKLQAWKTKLSSP